MDRLTIVVPTYDRPWLLATQLAFLEDEGIGHPILIADSSPDSGPDAGWEANAGSVRAHPGLRVEHVRFPRDISWPDKVTAALERVGTPYVVLCPDDDVLSPDALTACLDLLDASPDHVACHGDAYACALEDGKPSLSVCAAVRALDQDGVLERFLHMMCRYVPTIYAVHRAPVLARVMGRVAGSTSAMFFELLASTATLAEGRIGRVEGVFTIRNAAVPSIDSHQHFDPNHMLGRSPAEFMARYLEARVVMAGILSDAIPDLGVEEATRVCDVATALYMRRCFDSVTILHMQKDRGLIGPERTQAIVDGLFDRTSGPADPAAVADLLDRLGPHFARGWPWPSAPDASAS